MIHIHVINGPNLGRLGLREPSIYGSTTYEQLVKNIDQEAQTLGVSVQVDQSDHEAQLLAWIHQDADTHTPVILNAAGLTHTSIILRDACAQLQAPWVELHISNIHAREEFRHHSYLSAIATAVIAGCGTEGYLLALRYLAHHPHVNSHQDVAHVETACTICSQDVAHVETVHVETACTKCGVRRPAYAIPSPPIHLPKNIPTGVIDTDQHV